MAISQEGLSGEIPEGDRTNTADLTTSADLTTASETISEAAITPEAGKEAQVARETETTYFINCPDHGKQPVEADKMQVWTDETAKLMDLTIYRTAKCPVEGCDTTRTVYEEVK